MNVANINPFIISARNTFQTMLQLPITPTRPHLKAGAGPHHGPSAARRRTSAMYHSDCLGSSDGGWTLRARG